MVKSIAQTHTEHNVYQLQSVEKLFKYRDKFAQFVLIMHKLNCHMQTLSPPQLEQSLFFFIEHFHGFFLGSVRATKYKRSYLAYTEQEDHLSLTMNYPSCIIWMSFQGTWAIKNGEHEPYELFSLLKEKKSLQIITYSLEVLFLIARYTACFHHHYLESESKERL